MVRLTIGSGNEEGGEFKQIPPMRGVTLFLQSAEVLEADATYTDRIKWVFEIVGGADVPEEFVGETHWVFTNMPQSKSGKVAPNSNLYEILEGLSGGEFEPDDDVDTDEYVGREFTGDFKRVQKQEQKNGKWGPAFDADGNPIKKIKLVNLYPVSTRSSGSRRQRSWDDDDE